jgi:hypothetical protein
MSDTEWLMNIITNVTDIKIELPLIFLFSLVSVVCGVISSNHFWKIQSLLMDVLRMIAVIIGPGLPEEVCLIPEQCRKEYTTATAPSYASRFRFDI